MKKPTLSALAFALLLVRTHRVAILATFIFCIIASAAQAASTEWKPYPYGAPGDYPPVVDACEAGSYIVGFRMRSGAWVDNQLLQSARTCRKRADNEIAQRRRSVAQPSDQEP